MYNTVRIRCKHFDGDAIAVPGTYEDGSRALQLTTTMGEPLATVTVRVPGIAGHEVAIKNYSENEGLLEEAVRLGWAHEPHRFILSGYVTIPVCRVKDWPGEEARDV